MPITVNGVIAAFQLFRTAGCRNRPESQAAAVKLWVDILDDINDDELAAAARAHLRSEGATWWPMPGDVLKLTKRRQDEKIDHSDTAWGEARKIARLLQWRQTPAECGIETTAIMEASVLALGGWDRLGEMTPQTLPSIRASFRGAYRAYTDREIAGIEHPRLTEQEARAAIGPVLAAIGPCDGNHPSPACASRQCWQRDPPGLSDLEHQREITTWDVN